MKIFNTEIPKANPVLLAILTVLGALSFFLKGSIVAGNVLDIGIIICSIYFLFTKKGKFERFFTSPIVYIICAYCAFGFITAIYNEVAILDFIYAYKAFMYAAICYQFIGKGDLKRSELETLYFYLSITFLIVYLVKRFLIGDGRPMLVVENNYELMTLIFLYFSVYLSRERASIVETILLGAVLIVSGSRSALVAGLIIVGFVMRPRSAKALLGYGVVMVVAVLALQFVFTSRMDPDGLNGIDRVNFLNVFLRETSSWNPLQFLYGNRPLSPLSSEACGSLKYYKKLFSSENGQICYSVILHSFVLRTAFDHGLIGLIAIHSIFFFYMIRSGVSVVQGSVVMMAIIANGISVSSLNNGFIVLGIVSILLAEKNSDALLNLKSSSRKQFKRRHRGVQV